MVSPGGSPIADPLEDFARAVGEAYSTTLSGDPEDQLKPPVGAFLRAVGASLGYEGVQTSLEARVEGIGRPDLAVASGRLLVGHVELKQPGKGVMPSRFTGHDKRQWGKFKLLPNLIYTDGESWALYREGELEGSVVRLSGDPASDGQGAVGSGDANKLERLFRGFLSWRPIVPASPRALAEILAPLCHLLREDVLEALSDPESNLSNLAGTWREYLFPDADEPQFADAYAQTVTYSLLLARFYPGAAEAGLEGSDPLNTATAVDILRPNNELLSRTLRLLAVEEARDEISLGMGLLERAIGAVVPARVAREDDNPWLYFYEDFLAAYDPKLRKDRGVYYTPAEVVGCQVRLISELLEKKFGKNLSFADDGVVILDPACGTGTYPLAALQHGLNKAGKRYGDAGGRATHMAQNLHAFEILVGPYTVAHLKISKEVLDAGGSLPDGGIGVYLTDTLDSPHAEPPDRFDLFAQELGKEHARALEVKRHAPVLVCLGNPPYGRHGADAPNGGWVRYADRGEDERPIFKDFSEPAREAGGGEHLKNLYNDYVYFWRWALWKVFEADGTAGPGVVSFITASSYLRGPGFVGMREIMRRTFDELWIIDLEGGNLGGRKTPNVFVIQTPVTIAIGVRYGTTKTNELARVRYAKIEGTREEKLAVLAGISSFEDFSWEDCFSGSQDIFFPERTGSYFEWPLLTDLFPWQHSGVQMKRTWPIGTTAEVLGERWKKLLSVRNRAAPFGETRDRKVTASYLDLDDPTKRLQPLKDVPAQAPAPRAVRYGFRSFNRSWVLKDGRLGDYMRPETWRAHSERQIYLTSLLTEVLGEGPAATVSAEVPDLHYFFGRGGKDIVPLWRNKEATEPNITHGLLEVLSTEYGFEVSAEDLFCYSYTVLASPSYVERFWDELTIPGPRLPLTKDADMFRRAAGAGRELIRLHTYGSRFSDEKGSQVPAGRAKLVEGKGIPTTSEGYPEKFAYDSDTKILKVGQGEIRSLEPDVYYFAISGFEVVKSWLSYRMKEPSGRGASLSLNSVRQERWTPPMTEELMELLWILEATVEKAPELKALLDEVVASDLFAADELHKPHPEERDSPKDEAEPYQLSF